MTFQPQNNKKQYINSETQPGIRSSQFGNVNNMAYYQPYPYSQNQTNIIPSQLIPLNNVYYPNDIKVNSNYSPIIDKKISRPFVEQIPVESRIEYIPFQKKYIEYDQVQRIQRVPFERQIIEYEQIQHVERVPVERTITDYFAIEIQTQYIRKETEQTIVQYEPIEKVFQRVQYIPVETQIIHYPQRDNYIPGQSKFISASEIKSGSRVYVQNAYGSNVNSNYIPTKTINYSNVTPNQVVSQTNNSNTVRYTEQALKSTQPYTQIRPIGTNLRYVDMTDNIIPAQPMQPLLPLQ